MSFRKSIARAMRICLHLVFFPLKNNVIINTNHNRRFLQHIAVWAVLIGLYGCDRADKTTYPERIPEAKILKSVMIVAHRGGMAYAPENTAVGFKNGQRLETDILELDVQVRENEIIVLHDFTLDRTTDCSLQSSDADATARNSCDAGFNWRAGTSTFSDGAGYPLMRGTGIRIPLLADVVDGVSSSDVRFMIELKHVERGAGQPSIEQALDTLLTFIVSRSLENRVWLASFDPYVLSRAEAAVPVVSTMLIWDGNSTKTCEENVTDAISRGFDGVAPSARQPEELPQDFGTCIQLVQDAGMKVAFWIVNRRERVEQLLPLKPDMLLTDFPACLAALLRDIRIENPYPDDVNAGAYLPKCG